MDAGGAWAFFLGAPIRQCWLQAVPQWLRRPPTFSHPLPLHNRPTPHLQDAPAQCWPWPTGQTQRCHPHQEASGLGGTVPAAPPAKWALLCVRAVSSVVSDSAALWTVACQVPLSLEFSKQEYWRGLPFPSPGDPPGIELVSLISPALVGQFFYNYHHEPFKIPHNPLNYQVETDQILLFSPQSFMMSAMDTSQHGSILVSSSSWEPRTITNILSSRSHDRGQKQIVSILAVYQGLF